MTPPSVAKELKRFKDESDQHTYFMNNVSVPDPDGFISRTDIWDVYKAWVEEEGIRKAAQRRDVYSGVERAGAPAHKKNGERGFRGRRLVVKVTRESDWLKPTLVWTEPSPASEEA